MLRLTLRTLLAYLDDTLPPAQARDIGQQIADEPAIGDLIARIKSVMRRRRLQADLPDPDHAEIDPNEVAEYLDSRLSAARVTDLEKRILESDQDLAEVASVHQILSLVLGKPAEVPPSAKERAYKLVSSRSHAHAEIAPVGPHRQAVNSKPMEPITPLPSLDAGTTPTRWGTSIAVVALLVLLAGTVYMTVQQQQPRPLPPAATLADAGGEAKPASDVEPSETTKEEEAAPDAEETLKEPVVPEAIVPPIDSPSTSPADETPSATVLPADPLDDIPEIDATRPQPTPPPITDEPTTPPASPEEGIASPPAEAPIAAPDDVAAATPTPIEPMAEKDEDAASAETNRIVARSVPVSTYVSPTGILLRRADEEWSRLKPQSFVYAGDEIGHPDPGRSKLEHPNGLVLEMVGPTRLALRFDPDADLDFEIIMGRVVITSAEEPARVSVHLGETTWTLVLGSPGIRVALDLSFAPLTKSNPASNDARQLALDVVAGQVDVELGSDTAQVSTGRCLLLRPKETALPESIARPAPEWVDAKLETSVDRILARMSDSIPLGNGPTARYRELVSDNNKDIRALAVSALAVMGEVDALADSLRDPKFEPVRSLCFSSLRTLARLGTESQRDVQDRLVRMFRPEIAGTLMNLLQGYSADAIGRVATYRDLINHLDSAEIAVREAAIENLRELTGKDFNYSADSPSAQRNTAIGRWNKWLESQTDATLRELIPGQQSASP